MNSAYDYIIEMFNYIINKNSISKVSKKMKVTRPTIYSWLKNPEKMTIEQVNKLTKLYEYEKEYQKI